MCGFAAFFNENLSPDGRAGRSLAEAGAALAHRGPDDAGQISGGGWGMAFRRLAILDLSPKGAQPMQFAKGRFTLCFNGEIYNYLELRDAFGLSELRSTGDAEVLGELLAREGERILPRLRGMFAFIWWDEREGELLAARDRFGMKPLYFQDLGGSGLTAASEIKALKKLCDVGELSRRAVRQFFRWACVQDPDCIASKVESLEPGQYFRWSARRGMLGKSRFAAAAWDGETGSWDRPKSSQIEEVRERVIESVKTHLISDVPVGIFLSGGLDSSIIGAVMRHLGAGRIRAYSVRFGGGSRLVDESSIARRSAEFFGAEFYDEEVTPESLLDDFPHFVESLDQPSGEALNVYLVAKAAARDLRVVLSGTGADEFFGGYRYLQMMALGFRLPFFRLMSPRVRAAARRLFESLPPTVQSSRLLRAVLILLGPRSGGRIYQSARTVSPVSVLDSLLDDDLKGCGGQSARGGRSSPQRGRGWRRLVANCAGFGVALYLPNMLLRDSDAMSMAHSLELRTRSLTGGSLRR
ncbi:MAG: asparagine synthase (glutamine-hydrolyzing) [Verrucomicrobiales bacterium]